MPCSPQSSSQVWSGSWRIDSTRVCWTTSAPASWADRAKARVTPEGSTLPSTGSNIAPTKYFSSITGTNFFASATLISSVSRPR